MSDATSGRDDCITKYSDILESMFIIEAQRYRKGDIISLKITRLKNLSLNITSIFSMMNNVMSGSIK